MNVIEHSDEWRRENETDGALELWKQRATERRIAYAKLAEEHKTLVAQHQEAVSKIADLVAENDRLRERVASLLLDEPSKTQGLYAAIDELQRGQSA